MLDFKKELTGIAENIEAIDYILGYTEGNKTKNDVFEIYLSAKDLTLKNQAEIYFSKAISSYQKALKADDSDIRSLLNLEKELFDNMYYASDYTYKALENSVEAASLTANEISSKKSSMSSIRSKMQSGQATVLSYEKKLDTLTDVDLVKSSQQLTLEKSADNITSIKNNLDKAKNDLKNLEKSLSETLEDNKLKLTSKQNSIKNLETGLEITKKTYQEALEGPTTTNVINLQNEIKKAELNLSDAKKELDNFELRAPFSGIIRKVDLQVGDNLASDNSKYVYIENPDLIEIPVLLDQVDIVKVNIGQKATITFDAYPTEKVEGQIQLIDYTPVQSSGVVSYTIKIVITDEKFDKKVLSGMTADIEIITLEKDDVLVVSTKAISTQDNKSYVNLEKDGKIQKVEIQIGTASSGKTEVLSGLTLGDKVIINEVKASSSTTTSSSSSSLINLPGSGGGGGNNRSGGGFGGGPGF
ncbi:MAG: efflux RND transporter periplasmic adaptor subunit [Candidatus Altimarinota bacterium]